MIDLQKRTEQVGIILQKKGVNKVPPLRVVTAIDLSGSMESEFRDGSVQSAFDRLLGISTNLDSDGSIEVYGFTTNVMKAPDATPADYGKYIGTSRSQKGKFGYWPNGGTSYGPVLQKIVEDTTESKPGLFKNMFSKSNNVATPVFVLFLTDGETESPHLAENVIKNSQDKNIYFQMVAVGNDCSFRTLKYLADKYPNCGFTQMTNMKMSDDQLYSSLISDELVTFIKKFEKVSV